MVDLPRLNKPMLQQALTEPGEEAYAPRVERTGLPLETLQWVGRSLAFEPDGLHLHPSAQRLLETRR